MKNIRIIEESELHGETIGAGTLVKNVENGLAASLIVAGKAEEEPQADATIEIPVPGGGKNPAAKKRAAIEK